MKKSTSGFTIVELLIVIVVIAILAAISVVAYTGIQTRARASAIASDLQATEKAFHAYRAVAGGGSWWRESSGTLLQGGDTSISSIISNNSEFRNFLQKAPTTEGLGTSQPWRYDNDGDTYDGCSVSTLGVNIYIENVSNMALVQAIDDGIDDGNLSCGKLRYYSGSNNILYNLATSEN